MEIALNGKTVGQVVSNGTDRTDVVVMLPEESRNSLDALRAIPIATPAGTMLPLGSLARIDYGLGANRDGAQGGDPRRQPAAPQRDPDDGPDLGPGHAAAGPGLRGGQRDPATLGDCGAGWLDHLHHPHPAGVAGPLRPFRRLVATSPQASPAPELRPWAVILLRRPVQTHSGRG